MSVPEFKEGMNWGDMYGPAMTIANNGDREEAAEYVAALRIYFINKGYEPEDADTLISHNLGYYAGYYGYDTMRAVQDVFGAIHPVFGAVQ